MYYVQAFILNVLLVRVKIPVQHVVLDMKLRRMRVDVMNVRELIMSVLLVPVILSVLNVCLIIPLITMLVSLFLVEQKEQLMMVERRMIVHLVV